MEKLRLDTLLVQRGLVSTREEARGLIMAGKVRVGKRVIDKPGLRFRESDSITLLGARPFVSRGGIKLDHALKMFGIPVADAVALDIGASTGGFTHCLLLRGAKRVYALDVGRGQLELKLRSDPRVVVMERTNAHYPFALPEQVDLVTVDVSFISLEKVVPNALEHLKEKGWILALVKPQFEAGRRQVGKGGLVKDTRVHAQVLGKFILWSIDQGLRFRDLTPSPIPGAKGNREFFVLLQKPSSIGTG
ncbi:MAG: TlyA family RNA methyltransferase [Dehalococcoidia bacterium]